MFAERIPFFWARRDHARLLVCAPKRHKTQTHRKFTPRWGFTGNGAPWRTARWEPLLLEEWELSLPGLQKHPYRRGTQAPRGAWAPTFTANTAKGSSRYPRGGPKIKQRTAESRGLAAILSKIGVDSVPSGQKGAPFFDRVSPSPRDSAVLCLILGPPRECRELPFAVFGRLR